MGWDLVHTGGWKQHTKIFELGDISWVLMAIVRFLTNANSSELVAWLGVDLLSVVSRSLDTI